MKAWSKIYIYYNKENVGNFGWTLWTQESKNGEDITFDIKWLRTKPVLKLTYNY